MLRRAPARVLRRRAWKARSAGRVTSGETALHAVEGREVPGEEADHGGEVLGVPVAVDVGLPRAQRAAEGDPPPEARVAHGDPGGEAVVGGFAEEGERAALVDTRVPRAMAPSRASTALRQKVRASRPGERVSELSTFTATWTSARRAAARLFAGWAWNGVRFSQSRAPASRWRRGPSRP